MAGDTISPEHYAAWLSPAQVLSALKSIGYDASTKLVLSQLRAGVILAVARRITYWDSKGEMRDVDYRVMSRGHWMDIQDDELDHDDFWKTGIAKTYPKELAALVAMGEREAPDMIAVGIRFEPRGIRGLVPNTKEVTLADLHAGGYLNRPLPALAPEPSPPPADTLTTMLGSPKLEIVEGALPVPAPVSEGAPAPSNTLLPKVPRSDLKAWVAAYGGRNPDAHFADFLAAANARFRGQRVTERPLKREIAELGLTKTRGNPAIRRK